MQKQTLSQQIHAGIRWRLAKLTGDEKWIKNKQKKQVVRDKLTKDQAKERVEYIDKSARRLLKYTLTETEIYGLSLLFDRFAEDGVLELQGFLHISLLLREKVDSESSAKWVKKEKQFISEVFRLFEHSCVEAEIERDQSLREYGMKSMEFHEFLLMFSFWKTQQKTNLDLELADFYFHLFDVNQQEKLSRVQFVCALRCLFVASGYGYMDKHLFPARAKKSKLNFFQQQALGQNVTLKPLKWKDYEPYDRNDIFERARHEKMIQKVLDGFEDSYKLANFTAFSGFIFEELDLLQRGFALEEDLVLWLKSNAAILRVWQGGVPYSEFPKYFQKYGLRLYDHEFSLFAQDVHMFSHQFCEELEVKFHEFGIRIAEKLDISAESLISRKEFKKWLMLHPIDDFKLSYERVAEAVKQRMTPLVGFAPEFLQAVLKHSTKEALAQLKHRATVAKLTKKAILQAKPPKPLRNLLVDAEEIGAHFELRIEPVEDKATLRRGSTKRSPTLSKMLKIKSIHASSGTLLR